ncbi:hypothetical protein WJ59_28260 [Burkholderia gladioli]|uniref:hypothetical protein n=1 Tax=Burkholderia gladioli TaxID=28095 RepID=UPI0007597E07|nr:hypothetical protein [Burkholderia gladioli]KVM61507.1 hypothetical protein WJ59_28260 [Burkholderia gladioli]
MKTLLLIAAWIPAVALAAPPRCESWPINMGLVHLKNAGMTDPTELDESRTKAKLIAPEKVGKDLYRQVYDITYRERTGNTIEIITSSEASSEECLMSGVDVYVVSRKIIGQ